MVRCFFCFQKFYIVQVQEAEQQNDRFSLSRGHSRGAHKTKPNKAKKIGCISNERRKLGILLGI